MHHLFGASSHHMPLFPLLCLFNYASDSASGRRILPLLPRTHKRNRMWRPALNQLRIHPYQSLPPRPPQHKANQRSLTASKQSLSNPVNQSPSHVQHQAVQPALRTHSRHARMRRVSYSFNVLGVKSGESSSSSDFAGCS